MSAYTGRYQSRLFNFIAERSLRLGEAAARAGRHLRIAAKNAVQTALYPVYALFQTARRLDRQFQAAQRQRNPLPDADRPVCDTLDAARQLAASDRPIRGIASRRRDRQLVLVAPDNAVLDCISPQQQPVLDREILQAIAQYWRRTRLALRPRRTSYPQRLLHRWLGWMQTSPVATSLNWFRETERSPLSPRSPRRRHAGDATIASGGLTPSPEAIAGLDRRIADLERDYVIPIAEDPDPWLDKARAMVRAAIDYFFGDLWEDEDSASAAIAPGTAQLRQSHDPPHPVPELNGNQPRQLRGTAAVQSSRRSWATAPETAQSTAYQRVRALIQAAIAYFFGFDDAPLRSPSVRDPLSAAARVPTLPDPWDASELAGAAASPELAGVDGSRDRQLTAAPPLANPFGEFPAAALNVTPERPQPSAVTARVSSSNRSKLATAAPPSHDLTAEEDGDRDASAPEFMPEWLDTKVMDAHYVQHPLEAALDWLDRVMLAIETALGKLWNWLFRS